MKKTDIKIAKLTAKELLLILFDLSAPFFLASSIYKKSTKKYLAEREIDRAEFFEKIQYLRRRGYIQTFTENKEKFLELTPKGFDHCKFQLLSNLNIKRPLKWDGKWRLVIFDIPETKRHNRDIFREHLKSLNFIQIQKSIYTHPFECTDEITLLGERLYIKNYVTILIAEIIQGEEKIIDIFLNEGILTKSDLKIKKVSK